MVSTRLVVLAGALLPLLLLVEPESITAFTVVQRAPAARTSSSLSHQQRRRLSQENLLVLLEKKADLDDGVVELADAVEKQAPTTTTKDTPPSKVPVFISQGEIDPETLNPDLSDPKQARVIVYIIISLIPVLFLIPLMLGSRDLIPLDAVPPVQM